MAEWLPLDDHHFLTSSLVSGINVSKTKNEDHDSSDSSPDDRVAFRYICEFTLLMLLILGNSTVIWIIKTNNNLRNKANVFVVVLASADLCFGLCTILFTTLGVFYPWYYHPILCKLGGVVNTFFASLANITLCFVSIDRMIFVRKPIRYQQTCRFSVNIFCIGYILLHALCFATLPPLRGNGQFTHYAQTKTCILDVSQAQSFGYFTILYGFMLPCFILLFCYMQIFRAAKLQSIKIRSASFAKKPHSHDSTRRVLRDPKRGYQRTSKTLSRMVLLHFICWTPFMIILLITLYTEISGSIIYYAWMLILAKSSLEPWVYGMYNPAFRRSVRRGVAFFYCKGMKLRRIGNFGLSNRIRVYQVSPSVEIGAGD